MTTATIILGWIGVLLFLLLALTFQKLATRKTVTGPFSFLILLLQPLQWKSRHAGGLR